MDWGFVPAGLPNEVWSLVLKRGILVKHQFISA